MINKRIAFDSLRTIYTSLIGIVFITIASIALVELSGRISAKTFVSQKIDRLEKLVFSQTTNNAEINGKESMLKIEINLKSIIEYADQNIKNIKSDILARSLSFETLY